MGEGKRAPREGLRPPSRLRVNDCGSFLPRETAVCKTSGNAALGHPPHCFRLTLPGTSRPVPSRSPLRGRAASRPLPGRRAPGGWEDAAPERDEHRGRAEGRWPTRGLQPRLREQSGSDLRPACSRPRGGLLPCGGSALRPRPGLPLASEGNEAKPKAAGPPPPEPGGRSGPLPSFLPPSLLGAPAVLPPRPLTMRRPRPGCL